MYLPVLCIIEYTCTCTQNGEDGSSSDDDSGSESGEDDEIPVHSTKNVIAISFNANTTDTSTQTLDTQQCKCDEVMKKLDTILDVLTNIGDELVLHGSDIHNIRLKSEAIQDKLEQLVSC